MPSRSAEPNIGFGPPANRTPGYSRARFWLVVWASNWTVQVACQNRLVMAFDLDAHRRLVATNWMRTGLWTARCGIAV